MKTQRYDKYFYQRKKKLFATVSQIRFFKILSLRSRRKRVFFQDLFCEAIANEIFFKFYFAERTQSRFWSVFYLRRRRRADIFSAAAKMHDKQVRFFSMASQLKKMKKNCISKNFPYLCRFKSSAPFSGANDLIFLGKRRNDYHPQTIRKRRKDRCLRFSRPKRKRLR